MQALRSLDFDRGSLLFMVFPRGEIISTCTGSNLKYLLIVPSSLSLSVFSVIEPPTFMEELWPKSTGSNRVNFPQRRKTYSFILSSLFTSCRKFVKSFVIKQFFTFSTLALACSKTCLG